MAEIHFAPERTYLSAPLAIAARTRSGNVIVGTPDSVAEKLKQLRDEIGFDGTLAELNCGGLIRHDRVLNAIRLLCREVMPRFN